MKKLQIYRIDSRSIEKIDDPNNIISPEYKDLRWYAVDKKVDYMSVKKLDDGEFTIDIVYQENL